MTCDRKTMGGVALTLMLGACMPVDPGLGEAVRYDMAIQTVDPDPVYAADAIPPGSNGARAAAAVKRYRTDTVRDVQPVPTGGGSGGSGGSSSGGGGGF